MLGYNRTITRTNINVLINIGPGAGGGRKSRSKKGNLPNTFDDDCSNVNYAAKLHKITFLYSTRSHIDINRGSRPMGLTIIAIKCAIFSAFCTISCDSRAHFLQQRRGKD